MLGLGDLGGTLDYAVGSLEDRASLVHALEGVDTVVSSANGIIPSGRTMSVASMAAGGYESFISAAEEVGVRHWVQSSVPSYGGDASIPELAGKRLIETRLERSSIAATVVRNPAFMDVWLVMAGAKQAEADHPHATTKRPFGFMKLWRRMTGNLVAGHGILLAPGGRHHGAPFVATVDVARMMAGAVDGRSDHHRTIEAGGPEWLTWGEVAEILSRKAGREVRVVALPGWFARAGQAMTGRIMPSASNVLGLVNLVAGQPMSPSVSSPVMSPSAAPTGEPDSGVVRYGNAASNWPAFCGARPSAAGASRPARPPRRRSPGCRRRHRPCRWRPGPHRSGGTAPPSPPAG